MVQAPLITFEQFLDFDDGTEINDYELVNGRLVLMPEPDDWHEAIASFLDFMFQTAYRQAGLDYAVKRRSLAKWALQLGLGSYWSSPTFKRLSASRRSQK